MLEDDKRSKRLLRLVIAVFQMNGIALLSPLSFDFSSYFVAASLLTELPQQTLHQPILQILRYYQPSNVHCQYSTKKKRKCTPIKISRTTEIPRISTYLPHVHLVDEQMVGRSVITMGDGVFH